jgi:enamine deaminase RidA (YjgF/YER057c/UK114 family)
MSNVTITVTERAGRRCASSGSLWEPIVGYSRAAPHGNTIAVTGTVGSNADGTFSATLDEQTRRAFAILEAALAGLGGRLEHHLLGEVGVDGVVLVALRDLADHGIVRLVRFCS